MINKIKEILEKVNAKDIDIYDFEKSSPFFDYFVVATTTERQANAAINYFKKELDVDAAKVEGKNSGWTLLDLGSVIIHLFTKEEREYYQFENRLLGVKKI